MKNQKSLKSIIFMLIMLSVVLTTGTFAYWASFVEGTETSTTEVLTVGYGESVDTVFELTNTLSSGGKLVPSNQLENSDGTSVDEVYIMHTLFWTEENTQTQTTGTVVTGLLNVDYIMSINSSGSILDRDDYSNIYSLVHVNFDEDNSTSIELNGETIRNSYTITISEPSNQTEYNLIQNAEISVTFYYSVRNEDISIQAESQEVVIKLIETDASYFTASSYKIRDYNTEGGTSIVIPTEINGVVITELGQDSFKGDGLTEVVIQEGITKIAGNAFHSNELLKVTIPSSVSIISFNAFYGNDIETVTFEEGLTRIESGAFSDNNITSVTLPDSLTYVGSGAFGYGGNFITSITINSDVEIGNSSAFGWYGASFITLYEQTNQAGTYNFVNGSWTLSN